MKKKKKGMDEKVWWSCSVKKKHIYESAISARSRPNKPSGCIYCNGGTSKVIEEDSLHDKHPELRDEYIGTNKDEKDKNKMIEEMKIFCQYSEKTVYFKCKKYSCHIWPCKINDRTAGGQGCPYCCSPSKKICDCGDCNSRSVYYTHPHLRDEAKNPEILKNHTYGSGEKFQCICKDCKKEWSPTIVSRTRGSGCPSCLNKTEMKVSTFLEESGHNIIQGHNKIKFPWCINEKTNCKFMYDSLIKDHNIIVEVDGIQHFEYVKYYKNDVDENIRRDVYKIIKANENNYSVIRLYQQDVWKDKNNWKEWLIQKIEFIIKNKGCFVFFPDKKEYDKHKELYYKMLSVNIHIKDDSPCSDEGDILINKLN